MIDRPQDLSQIKDAAVDSTLKTLRDQRDVKQHQSDAGNYAFNPQIFNTGNHFVVGPIYFKVPYQTTPAIVYGRVVQRATENIGQAIQTLTSSPGGYVPLLVDPYTFGFDQDAGGVKAFYMGLYCATTVPESAARYLVSWYAQGRGVSYPSQRISEAWNSSYNKNEAEHLINETGETDDQ